MSVLEREDIARRVSAALEAVVVADAGEPKAKISLLADVPPPAIEDAAPVVEEVVEEVVEVAPPQSAPPEVAAVAADDDVWVVESDPIDPALEVAPAGTRAPAPVEPVAPVEARPRRSRERIVVAAVLLVLAGLGVWLALVNRDSRSDATGATAGASAAGTPTNAVSSSGLPTLHGTFTVWGSGTASFPCARVRTSDEPIAGDSVRLRGTDSGRLIMGTLDAGSITRAGRGCVYPFELANIPPADKYILQVSKQGSIIFTREQLESVHWRVSMSLGSPSAG